MRRERAEEVTDEPLYRDRVCGIDLGKAGMCATIRVPSDKDPARRASETRELGTMKRDVLALADWLRSWQVSAVAMEATLVISGPDDQWPCFRRWDCPARVRHGKIKSGIDEGQSPDQLRGRLSVSRTDGKQTVRHGERNGQNGPSASVTDAPGPTPDYQ